MPDPLWALALLLAVVTAATAALATIFARRAMVIWAKQRRVHGSEAPCMKVVLYHGEVPAYRKYANTRDPIRGRVLCSLGSGHLSPCMATGQDIIDAGYAPAPF